MRRQPYRHLTQLLLSFCCCLVFINCNSADADETPALQANAYTVQLAENMPIPVLDSSSLATYIRASGVNTTTARKLKTFYRSREYAPAWLSEDGISEQAFAFWNLHNHYLRSTRDSSIFNPDLQRKMAALEEDNSAALSADAMISTEFQLTEQFFRYARYAYEGSIDPTALQWHIPRRKVDAVQLLDSLLATKGERLDDWEPVNADYRKIKKHLLRYHNIEKNGGWSPVTGTQKTYRMGDSAAAVVQIKQRLSLSGDYTGTDMSGRFDEALVVAVQRAQQRFGLSADGIVGPATKRALNVPVRERIQQMLINMERMKWMPPHEGKTRLVANIPDYTLHVYEGGQPVFNMKIVVGKSATRTVVFDDLLEYVVFSPYWNIPASIVQNEILPAMRNNPAYLAQNNMEQTGEQNGVPVLRQKPGAHNALGRVKFLFPNNYSIYFHDTPAKHLFERDQRAFSHGCVRLEQPARLAEYLLQDQQNWSAGSIRDAMYSGTEKWVKLAEPVPVYLSYFTAWVDDDGMVNFRDDIYGHDEKMKRQMFD